MTECKIRELIYKSRSAMAYLLGFSGSSLYVPFSHDRSRSGEHIVYIDKVVSQLRYFGRSSVIR